VSTSRGCDGTGNRKPERHDLAPASVVTNLGPVKALFATAVDDGKLRSNPDRRRSRQQPPQ
jgi:hypothetical protein